MEYSFTTLSKFLLYIKERKFKIGIAYLQNPKFDELFYSFSNLILIKFGQHVKYMEIDSCV